MKQLLVILNFILLSLATCPLSSELQGMSLHPITLVNMQLNATVADYPIAIVNASAYSFAVAVTQVEVLAPWGWNVTVKGNGSTAIVTLKSEMVNWVKVACVVWASNRADLVLGSTGFAPSMGLLNGSSSVTTQTVTLSRQLTYPQASLVVAYINGFRMVSNASLEIRVVPFKVQKNSFDVNITTVGCSLSSVLISYAVFSPSLAAFQVYGDSFPMMMSQSHSFDVSQQIPNIPSKIWGLSQLSVNNIGSYKFQSAIDEDFVLSISVSTLSEFTLLYLYFLPEVYSCPASCNATIIYNGSCLQSCPAGTILTTNGDVSFCRSCSNKLGKKVGQNGTACVCKEGYGYGGADSCIKEEISLKNETVKVPDTNTTIVYQLKTENSTNASVTVKNSTDSSKNTSTLVTNSTNITTTNTTINITSKSLQNSTSNSTNATTNPTNTNLTNSTSNSTNSTITNCSKISNSMPINGKCLCLVGYVNLSNNCVPLVSLGSPFQIAAPSTSTPAIKASSACLDNQQFSLSLNRCVCVAGFQLAANKCVGICSSVEQYDNTTNSCRCIAGFTRVNSVCNFCVTGNPNCYILTRQYCRNDFILLSGSCVACSSISISNKSNTSCTVCSLGYVYNGSACVCPTTVVNQTCLAASCGNKRIDTGETCDDGNVINGDGCSSLCNIEMNFYCSGLPSLCIRTILGNGIVTGGQECDDGNTINGDGCSAQGLQEPGFTCVGNPSSCFNVTTGNLTLITLNQTTNNVYVIFQTPKSYSFPNSAFMQSFLTYKILKQSQTAAMIYCQQQLLKLNRFDCLLIFPSGVPLSSFIVQFNYNYEGTKGSSIVEFKYVPKS